ncbi:MAG TPA: response regulator [Bryobacteraceae bacterium]|jgi:AmiR/NasT family two-component response regulator|nr:response regulator [Bryobacteraceae bacterium]
MASGQTTSNKHSAGPALRKVLIVEDEGLIALDIKGRLENSGYEVPGIAASADLALSLADRHTPDLILMDIRLQGGSDGIKAATEVRRRMDIPVIFMTAHSDLETLERAQLSQPFGYVVKPFGALNFHALIETALRKHETERTLRESVTWHNTLEKRRLTRLFEDVDQDRNAVEEPAAYTRERPPFDEASLEALLAGIITCSREDLGSDSVRRSRLQSSVDKEKAPADFDRAINHLRATLSELMRRSREN